MVFFTAFFAGCKRSFVHLAGLRKFYSNLANSTGGFTMSTKMKLHYLDIRGYGEVARLQFAYSGTEYEDVRYDEKTDWLDHKETMPLHHVPVLEMDGVKFPQSLAIWSYLAKMYGLYPADPKDQMIVDIIGLTSQDLCGILCEFYYMDDGPEKEKKKEATWPKSVRFLNYLENLLATSGTGYFVENRLTLADLIMFDILTGMNRHVMGPLTPGGVCEIADLKDRYPWMAKNLDNVLKNEKIAAYVKDRKPSLF